jgi:hypothetical protein
VRRIYTRISLGIRRKILALIITSMTTLLVVLLLLSYRATDNTSLAIQRYRYAEPFRGVEVGIKLLRACGDCHSNQTNLPWYGHVAPVSWWVQSHVHGGRKKLNFSEWKSYSARQRRDELESICGVISIGRMPPASYTAMHPHARLAASDKQAVCVWAATEIKREK